MFSLTITDTHNPRKIRTDCLVDVSDDKDEQVAGPEGFEPNKVQVLCFVMSRASEMVRERGFQSHFTSDYEIALTLQGLNFASQEL